MFQSNKVQVCYVFDFVQDFRKFSSYAKTFATIYHNEIPKRYFRKAS